MTGRRILYLLTLLVVLALHVANIGYFTWILLCLVTAFIPVQLLLSLPAWLGARVQLGPGPGQAQAGGPFPLGLAVVGNWAPARLKADLLCRNRFTKEETRLRLKLRAGTAAGYTVEVESAQCGLLELCLRRPRMLDMAGLFALPLRRPQPVLVLARPPVPALPLALPDAALDQSALPHRAEGAAGPGAMREFADIREYRPGAPLRDIHWKLTAKFDKMMVREGSFSSYASPRLCFDLFGDATDLSATLGQLEALSGALSDLERLHALHWLDEASVPQARFVATRAEFDAWLWHILSTPLPAQGTPIETRLPEVFGPVMVVGPGRLALYEEGRLREVLG